VIKWDEVQTKVLTWGIIALLGLMGTTYIKLIVLETKVDMIQQTVLDVWESQ
jgi:hypothetical protein